MKGKKEDKKGGGNDRRNEILRLCYDRLRCIIPECDNEVTLLKCIEILEKQNGQQPAEGNGWSVIADTLDRLARIERKE